MISVDQVAAVIRGHRYSYTSEDELQEGIAAALVHHGFKADREVRLSAEDRIDLMVDDAVGIEVKIAGNQSHPYDQLKRYAGHNEVKALILVTSRGWEMPDTIGEVGKKKPLRVVSLLGAGL